MFEFLATANGKWYLAAFLGWVGVLFASLQLQQLPGDFSHSVCGPWGCGPPLQSLLACHGFWATLFVLPTGCCARSIQPPHLRRLGYLLTTIGFCSLIVVAIWQSVTWLPAASEWQREYFLQRYLFSIGTLIDVPMVQALLAGLFFIHARTSNGQSLTNVKSLPFAPAWHSMQLLNFPAMGMLPFSGGVRATLPSGMYSIQYQSL
jgi:hypothetical protein